MKTKKYNRILMVIILFIFVFLPCIKINASTIDVPAGKYQFLSTINGENQQVNFRGNWYYNSYNECETANPNAVLTICNQPVLTKAIDDAISVGAAKDTSIKTNNTYTFLASLPGLGDSIKTSDIGSYFNTIFRIAIGLCAALAVIMIIIYAVQYMGDESIFGKSEAKGKIGTAILGLLIAIGSWVLLNTINPDLTGKNGVNVSVATGDVETVPWETYQSGTGATDGCKEGFVDVLIPNGDPNKINVCKSISNNLTYMINAAKRESISLSGYGFRSKAKQEEKRSANCGGSANIYVKNAKCTPPTAIPGTSNHESGLAVDFRCNGKSMTVSGGENSICFKWLKTNALKYNFKNLASESWHWSVDGK